MKILAIDTATEACSAALSIDGEIISRYELAPRKHTERLIPMLDEVLEEAAIKLQAIDAVAFGRGPGSFTGVRIAAASAQGIAFSADLPVIPVSTLAAMAQRALLEKKEENVVTENIITAIDARMNEVYWCAYEKGSSGLVKPLLQESVVPPEHVTVPEKKNWHCVGTGFGAYADILGERLKHKNITANVDFFPDAASICRLAEAEFKADKLLPAEQAIPVYLRDNVAKKKAATQ